MPKDEVLQLSNARAIYDSEDYTQSANALFHFMSKKDYLETALSRKALVPRFCLEDISYLGISIDGNSFNEIAVLEKCFCDIPLHKIIVNFNLELSNESRNSIEGVDLKSNNTHTGYYGEFAIAFSKTWCESHNLQPVHYLNEMSSYTASLRELINGALSSGDISDEYANYSLQRLALVKPIRGHMKRYFSRVDKSIETIKNFHDEQEWRYIPKPDSLIKVNRENNYSISPIIANPHLLNHSFELPERFIDKQSSLLENEQSRELWISFDFADIRYLIVPDKQARLELIEYIMNLSKNLFSEPTICFQEKYVLISKILVLDEIRKDW